MEDNILSRFFKRKASYNILVREKRAKKTSLYEAIHLLQNPTGVEDLIEVADILEQNNIAPKDIDAAIEMFEADRGTADAYIEKAIADLEKVIQDRVKLGSMEVEAYKYSSTQVDAPQDLAREVFEWGKKNIPEEEIYREDGDQTLGREDHPHVTVKYGLHTADAKEIENVIKQIGPIEIELGLIANFEPEDKNYDVLKIDVEGDKLREANLKISELENSDTHPEYKPHMTIAYLKKSASKKYLNRQDFKGKKFRVDNIIFSARTGEHNDAKSLIPIKLI